MPVVAPVRAFEVKRIEEDVIVVRLLNLAASGCAFAPRCLAQIWGFHFAPPDIVKANCELLVKKGILKTVNRSGETWFCGV